MRRPVYAVGDVHGRHDLLTELLASIAADAERFGSGNDLGKIVMLGDYVDRGPASKQVIETLRRGVPRFETVCLKGNHEAIMRVCLELPSATALWRSWCRNGAIPTIESYGALRDGGIVTSAFPAEHRKFLEGLPSFHDDGERFFVHAGIRPGVALDRQEEEDLLEIREPFLSSAADHGRLVVHGHSALEDGPTVLPNRLNLDTMACFTGVLTCAAFDPGVAAPRFIRTGRPVPRVVAAEEIEDWFRP